MSFIKDAFITGAQAAINATSTTMRLGLGIAQSSIKGVASAIPTPGLVGVLGTFGFEPVRISPEGHVVTQGWGQEWTLAPSTKTARFHIKATEEALAHADDPFWSMNKLKSKMPGATGFGSLSTAFNMYFAYQGYQENGFSGAYNALALNAAVEASMYKWSYGIGTAKELGGNWLARNAKVAGHPLVAGASSPLLRGAGAFLGGSIGQQIGLATGLPFMGTAGATVGAYFGGAPLQALQSRPLLAMGSAIVGGAVLASYGAYYGLKTMGQMGYAHRQSLKGVNTDGSMASFMTQNALTMRERSVQAIAKSHMNARSALGQEASFMHSPRNYNSMYR